MCALSSQEMFRHTDRRIPSTLFPPWSKQALQEPENGKEVESSMIPQILPGPQVRQANHLDEVDPYLTKKYKEEHEEAERVVRPVEREELNHKRDSGTNPWGKGFATKPDALCSILEPKG